GTAVRANLALHTFRVLSCAPAGMRASAAVRHHSRAPPAARPSRRGTRNREGESMSKSRRPRRSHNRAPAQGQATRRVPVVVDRLEARRLLSGAVSSGAVPWATSPTLATSGTSAITAAAVTAAQSVVGLTLINADTDQPW